MSTIRMSRRANPKWVTILVVSLLLHPGVLRAQYDFKTEDHSVSIQGEGITLRNIRPGLEYFPEDSDGVVNWKPDGSGRVKVIQKMTPLGEATCYCYLWEVAPGIQLEWEVSLIDEESLSIQCRLSNAGESPLRIRRFLLMDVPAGQMELEGEKSDWMSSSRYLKYARYYDKVDDLQRRGQLVRDQEPEGEITRYVPYDEDFCLYTAQGQKGISISAVGDVSFIWAHLKVPEDGRLGLDVCSEMTGIEVEPGECRESECILVQFTDWKTASEHLVHWLRCDFQPRDTPAIFGWCSWYCLGTRITQEDCEGVSRFVKGHMDRYPFEVIQVDEGYQLGRHSAYANQKFPDGLTHLADEFKAPGSMAGIWLCPISPDAKNNPRFDESWYIGYRKGKPGGKLDPSHPVVQEFINGELGRLKQQGYHYFKTDFSLVSNDESGFHDQKLTQFQAQRLYYSIMREAIGEDAYLLACNGGPPRAVLGLADATRIGTDTGTKWGFCQDTHDFGKPANVHGAWFPIVQIGGASFYTHLMACDPDVTRVDQWGLHKYDPRFFSGEEDPLDAAPKLSLESVQTFHGIQGLYGGTMMISDLIHRPGYQADKRLRMVEIMHPVTPDKGYNFGGGYDLLNHQFGFLARRPWGSFISMVTWNPDHKGSKDLYIDHAPYEELGERFHLWSFWNENYLGIQDKDFVFDDVPKYHSHLLRLTPVKTGGAPTLIGSNLHMSMGAAEIRHIKGDAETIMVELIPTAGALEGQLVFYSDRPLEIRECRGMEAFLVKNGKNEYKAVLTRRDRNADTQILALQVVGKEAMNTKRMQKDPDLMSRWKAGTMTLLK